MSGTPGRRRVIISSDEEDAASEQKDDVYLSDDDSDVFEDSDVVESSQNDSAPVTDESLHSPILAGHSSFASSKDRSGHSAFSTSTPCSKTSRRSDFKALEDSIRSLSDSGDELRPGDRSRSFLGDQREAVMSPISAKLSQRNDSVSNQKLRERLFRKAISEKKAPPKDKDPLFDTTLSPIHRKPDRSSSTNSLMSVQEQSSEALDKDSDGAISTSRKSEMEDSFFSTKSEKHEKKKASRTVDLDDVFDAGESTDGSRRSNSVVSMESRKSNLDSSKLPRKSHAIISSDEEESDDDVVDAEEEEGEIESEKSVEERVDSETGNQSLIEESNGSIILDDSTESQKADEKEEEDEEKKKEESASIIILSSDDDEEENEKEKSVIEMGSSSGTSSKENSPKSKKLPEHLSKYANESISILENRIRLAERTLNSVGVSSLKDGGVRLKQTLKDLEDVITFKRENGDNNPTPPVVQHSPPKPPMPQQRPPPAVVPPPKFDPAQYGQLLANDKKRLFGGKMTADRWQNIQSSTERALKGMHEAMNSRPDENCIIETPKGLKVELMPHQKQGLAWMVWREQQTPPGGILADDMGLGKTLSTISLIMHQKNERLKRKEDENDEQDKRKREIARKMGLQPSNATLVVAPASVIYQWEAEIERRVKTDRLLVEVFHGPKNKRESDPRRLAKYDVVITTFNLLATELTEKITTKNNEDDASSDDDSDEADNWGDQAGVSKSKKKTKKFNNTDSVLAKIAWDRIILDEAHQIKNKSTGASKAACRIAASNRWCLTGTPIHNNLWDMFSLIRFLRVAPFDDETHWKEYIMGNSQKCADRMNMLTRNLLLRRTKQQTCSLTNKPLVDLKPKEVKQHDLVLEGLEAQVYDLLFTATQQKVRQMLTEAENDRHAQLYGVHRKKRPEGADMKNPFNFGPRTINSNDKFQQMSCMLVMLLRLRQACVHMHLTKEAVDMDAFEHLGGSEEDADALLEKTLADLTLDEGDAKDEIKAAAIFERNFLSCKVKKLMEIVDEVNTVGDKIVIVSQWTSLLNIVEERLIERKARYTSITGQVLPADRQERVDSFNKENGGARVLLLSLTAGGVGLNLVGGNHLVMVDLHWNPALEAQACDRIYRMGQKKTVYIHRLITSGTIEQRVLDLQQKKLELAGAVLEGAASKKMNKLTYADLKYLFDLDEKKKEPAPRPVQPPLPPNPHAYMGPVGGQPAPPNQPYPMPNRRVIPPPVPGSRPAPGGRPLAPIFRPHNN